MENWYKLDNAAKIFPSITNNYNSSVYRVSAVFNEKIDKDILQKALDHIYNKYPMLFVSIRKGFFWDYLDVNNEKFLVEREKEYPCKPINKLLNKGYFLKVLYYEKRVSVEIFHSLTDGSGAIEFLKSLIYYYFVFLGKIEDNNIFLNNQNQEEDSFLKYFKNVKFKTVKQDNAYIIKGKRFKNFGVNVTSGNISVNSIKKIAKENRTTVTGYLISLLIYSIYKTNKHNNKKPIVVAVPVNLRKKFPSETLRNFFGVVNVGMAVNKNTSFKEIIKKITKQLQEETTITNLQRLISYNVNLEKNKLIRFMPQYLKKPLINFLFNKLGENKKTIALSNLGNIELDNEVKEYISHLEFILYPTIKSPINCGICSYNDILTINFSKTIIEKDTIRYFFNYLSKEDRLDVSVYSNSWGDNDE
jgi:NRPS condensation-like uncharacterized protein